MRVAIIDHSLHRAGGHPFNMALGMIGELGRRGISCRIYTHNGLDPSLAEQLGARPVFEHLPYDGISSDPLTAPLDNMWGLGHAFAAGCETVAADGLSAEDLVLVPVAFAPELFGCALWLERMPPGRRPRIVLNLMGEDYYDARAGRLYPLRAAAYRFAAGLLQAAAGSGRAVVTSHVQGAAGRFEKLTGLPVRVGPVPMYFDRLLALQSQMPRGSDGPVSIAYLGASHPGKGHHWLPYIFRRLGDGGRPVRGFVQMLPPGSKGRLSPEDALSQICADEQQLGAWRSLLAVDREQGGLEILFGEMGSDEYYRRLLEADIVLLPYDPARYAKKTSGIFSEAVAAGKVVVAPRNTWMGTQVLEGRAAGELFDRFEGARIAAALDRAVRSVEELGQQAGRLAAPWRADNSVGRYLDIVLEGTNQGSGDTHAQSLL